MEAAWSPAAALASLSTIQGVDQSVRQVGLRRARAVPMHSTCAHPPPTSSDTLRT